MSSPKDKSHTSQLAELESTSQLLGFRRYAAAASSLTIIFTALTFGAGLLLSSKERFAEAFPQIAAFTAVITILESTFTLVIAKNILGKSRPTVLKREISAVYFMNLKKTLRPSGEK